ncbi:MAG: exodeoxyribonuclease I [Candidatus Liberibacter ctenarytainae]|uniref:Exodeoxyribonuclease I n=1 Tax=Candidatus Liberibacter ctenarytainae TaxID=2020335 RepID=A0A937AC89_9HYPH|nr:exodeoxyribonuclease I [Candidatus Liberibacter ctenarytainae]
MDKQFLIYDYETFGLDKSLDRPAQFASIRVDHQFKKIEDKHVFFCQPSDDYLPNPESVLKTGITPQQACRDGIVEADFCRKIHQILSEPNTCIVGYNNIRFDDEFSRYMLYRNLRDPYRWHWDNNNSRWDLMDVVRAYYVFCYEDMQWPLREDGLPSFRLEDVVAANGIDHGKAHDAEMDVHATLAIVQLLRRVHPKLFDYLYSYREKKCLEKLINIEEMEPLVHISGMLGAYRGNTTLIAPIARHPVNHNAVIVCDLSADIQVLEDLDSSELHTRLYTRREELGDFSAVPLKLVHTNKCPILLPIHKLSEKNAARLGIDIKRCLDNLTLLRKQKNISEKVIAMYQKDRFISSDNVDSQLYDGFFQDADRAMMDTILATDPEKLQTLDINSNDKRLKPLLFRYRARNFSHTLDSKEQERWREYRKTVFTQSRIDEYIEKLQLLYASHIESDKSKQLIHSLFEYLQQIFPEGVKVPFMNFTDNHKKNGLHSSSD